MREFVEEREVIRVRFVFIFEEGQENYGPRELSPNIIKRLEEKTGVEVLAPGFPAEMLDDEPEEPGYEVKVKGR